MIDAGFGGNAPGRGINGYALACKARILRQVTVIGKMATRLAWLLT